MTYFSATLLKTLSTFNKSSVIFGIMIFPVMAAPLTYATTWHAVDTQEANVAAAIANASDGDTVTVPAGTATWSAQLTITKHITLQGAGVGQTIIYDNAPKGGSDQHLILVTLSGDNPPFRLSGFEFGIPANYTVIAQPYGVGILEFQGAGGTVVPGMSANVRVDHCKIKVAGVAMTFRNVLGLVDHVEWIDSGLLNPTTASYWGGWQSASIYMPNWGGKDWGHGSWADAPNWGTDKFLFFEDCSFAGVRRNGILFPIDAYEGARYVARYCTFKDAKVGGTGTEGQGRGRKQTECYNNTFISSELIAEAQSCTSGTILVHDNLETNYRNGIGMQVYRQYQGPLWGHSTGRSPWDENDDFPQAYESGTCTASANLGTARSYHTATLLANGNVLVVGGTDGTNSLASAELYGSVNGTWTTTGSVGTAREVHTSTLLPDGKVLVVGGTDGANSLVSAELYDPATGMWSASSPLHTGRYYHTATLLANGNVLVVGGTDGTNSLASAELYDPATGTWTTTGNLGTARSYHTATLLTNGSVLVVGGTDGTSSLASAELYDPATDMWSASSPLSTGRYYHTATLLANGNVLVVGGTDGTNSLASAPLYDPSTRAWKVQNNVSVTDNAKSWAPDQWLGDGVSFIIINLSSPVDKNGEHAQSYLIGNTSNTLKQGKGAVPFQVGDRYEIWKVKTSLDQPGQGSGILLTGLPPNASPVTWPQRGYPREPCYSWNNIDPTTGRQMDIVADEPSIKLGRDYFNRTPKPGYTPFVYPHPLVNGVSSTPTPTPTPTVQVTVQTAPVGLAFTVDGTTYSSTQTFSWASGSSHTIAATSPQGGGTGIQYVWKTWSDNQTISHNVAPTTNKTYTANFTTQYYLTMSHGTGGTVSPASGWKNSGAAVSINATPISNTSVSYNFSGWTGTGMGSYSGTNNPASITMSGPITETATFTQNPVQVSIQTNPAGRSFSVDGTTYTAAQSFSWGPGSNHTIATTSPQSGDTGIRYVWTKWSDGGAISHTVAPTTNKTYTATFNTQYYLTMTRGTGGTVTPSSGWRNNGAAISLKATPATGYTFSAWTGSGTGSYTGSANPSSVTIGGPITETASFTH
jgi:Divergent InlB B-repeat domain/Galactose oxidase, central domain/Kelch motif